MRNFRIFILIAFGLLSAFNIKSQPVTMAISSVNSCAGASHVAVPITVNNFTAVEAISIRIVFNPANLSFDTATNHPSLNGLYDFVTGGYYTMSFFSVTPITLPNGTTLFTLYFDVITNGTVSWDPNPNYLDISNAEGSLPVNWVDGGIATSLPSATISSTPSVCPGQQANVTLEFSEGNPPFNFQINDGVNPTVSYTCSEYIYSFSQAISATTTWTLVSLTDGSSCSVSPGISTTTDILAAPNIFSVTGSGTFCNSNETNVQLNGSQNGIVYELYYNGSATGTTIPGNGDPISFGAQTQSGSYTIFATGDCGSILMSGSSNITLIQLPVIQNIIGGGSYCTGTSPNGEVQLLSSEPGINYQLKKNGTAIGQQIIGNGNPMSWNNLSAGSYTITANNSCGNSEMNGIVTVNENTNPTVQFNPIDPVCNNSPSITLNAQPLGGTFSGNGVAGNIFDPAIVNPGNYPITYSYSDGNGCTGSSVQTVTVIQIPQAYAGPNQTINNGTSTTLNGSASNGSGNYSYGWTPSSLLVNPTIQNPQTINLSSTTTFNLLVTDLNTSCQSLPDQVTVSITGDPLSLIAGGNPSTICSGQSSQLSAAASGGSGNYSFSWSSIPAGFTSTSQNPSVTPSITTTYTVTVTDGYSSASASKTITVNPKPIANAGTDKTIAYGTSTTLSGSASNGSGNYSYTWTPSNLLVNPTIQNPQTINLNSTTTFNLLVTDLNTSCQSLPDQVTVSVTGDPLSVIAGGNPSTICSGQSSQLSAAASGGSGNYTYSWSSNPAGFSSSLQNPQVTPSVTTQYTVTVNDGYTSTTASKSIIVNPLPGVVASATPQVVYTNASVQLEASPSGGSGSGYTFVWSGPDGFSSTLQSPMISNIQLDQAGFYYVTVTDAHSCTGTDNISVTVQPNDTVYATIGTVITSGCDSLVIVPVLVNNFNNIGSVSLSIIFDNIVLDFSSYQHKFGTGGFLTANVIGDTNFRISWFSLTPLNLGNDTLLKLIFYGDYGTSLISWDNEIVPQISNIIAETLPVSTTNGSATVSSVPQLAGPISGPENVCQSQNGVSYSVTPIPGAITYQWGLPSGASGSSTSNSISIQFPAIAGTGTLKVRGYNNCGYGLWKTQQIVINTNPTANAGDDAVIYVGASTNLTGNASGGSGNYSFHWEPTSMLINPDIQNPQTVSLFSTQNFYLTVIDNLTSCQSTSDEVTISIGGSPLSLEVSATNTTICAGLESQLISTVTGGTGNYTYSWTSNPAGFASNLPNPIVNPLISTTYSLIVSDGVSNISANVIITVNSKPNADATNNGPICAGSTLNLSGGENGMTTYQWNGPEGYTSALKNPSRTNAQTTYSGIYQLIITNSNGCKDTSSTIVTVNAPPIAEASNNSPICTWSTLNLNCGVGEMSTYQWSGPGEYTSSVQNPFRTNAQSSYSGIYQLIISDANGCKDTVTTIVFVYSQPTATATNNSPLCTWGTLSLTGGASGMVSYQWSGPGEFTSALQNPSQANAQTTFSGDYQMIITNSDGCKDTAYTTVVVHAQPTATASSNSPLCTWGTLNLTGGTSGMNSYQWSGPGNFTSSLQNPIRNHAQVSHTGNYQLIITNSNGCKDTANTAVAVNAQPTAIASTNSPLCSGNTLNLTAGTNGMASYQWSGPEGFSSSLQYPSVPNAQTAHSGSYRLIVTDLNNCKDTAYTTVTVFPQPMAVASNNGPICSGSTLNLSGGPNSMIFYQWSGPEGFSSSLQYPSVPNAQTAHSGSYQLIVTDLNNCKDTAYTAVTVFPQPLAVASNNGPLCSGSILNLSGGPNSMVSYQWSGPEGFSSSLQYPSVPNAQTAHSGSYRLIVTDLNNCKDTAYTAVTVFPLPLAVASNNGPLCSGSILNLTGGPNSMVSYQWSGPEGFSSSLQYPSVSSAQTAHSGSYRLIVTDLNNCKDTAYTTVTVFPQPIAVASNNGPLCSGSTLNLSGGPNSMIFYQWSGPEGFSSSLQYLAIANAHTAHSGSYRLIVTDLNNCKDTSYTAVTVFPQPLAVANNNSPLCSGSTLNLTGGPNSMVSYQWSGPEGFSSSLQHPSVPNAQTAHSGSYQLIVTDLNNCKDTAYTAVTVFPQPLAVANNNGPLCSGSTLNLTGGPNSMVSYQWSGPEGFSSSLQYPSVPNVQTAHSGSYQLIVTDLNNCKDTAYTAVTVFPLPMAVASNNGPLCSGSTLNLSGGPNSMIFYQWSGPEGFISDLQYPAVPNAQTAHSGSYRLIVTDLNNCKDTAYTTVTVFPQPMAVASNNGPLCSGSTLNFTGGPNSMVSYQWSGPEGFSSSLQYPSVPNAQTAHSGSYQLIVTDLNNCKDTAYTAVTVFPLPMAVASNNGPLCSGSILNLSGGPNSMVSYQWSGPEGFSSSLQYPSVSTAQTTHSGSYQLIVTDLNNCKDTAYTAVTVFPLPMAVASNNGPLCSGSTLNLTGGPNSMASYQWSGPEGFISDLQYPSVPNGQTAHSGSYQLIVTDLNNCKDTAYTAVTVFPLPMAAASNNGPLCSGSTLNFTGGPNSMVSYQWSGPEGFSSSLQYPSVPNAQTAHSGSYQLIVTDLNNCKDTAYTAVTVFPLPMAVASNNGPLCSGSTLNFTGGPNSMVSYQWSGPEGFSSSLQHPSVPSAQTIHSGSYQLIVTDLNNCKDTAYTAVSVFPLPMAFAGNNGPLCAGQNLTLFGGETGLFSYQWTGSNGYSSQVQNPVIENSVPENSGLYTLVVTTEFGCKDTANTLVNIKSLPLANTSGNQVINYGSATTLEGASSICSGGCTFNWQPASLLSTGNHLPNPTTVNLTQSTVFQLIVYSSTTQCYSLPNFDTIFITGDPLSIVAGADKDEICQGESVHLTVQASGGVPSNYTFKWSGPQGYSSIVQNPVIIPTGSGIMNYQVTVSDYFDTLTASVSIILHEELQASANNGGNPCEGDNILLLGNSQNETNYQWIGPDNFISNLQNPVIINCSASNSGNYTLVVGNEFGCKDTAYTQIIVYNKSVAPASSNSPVCEGDTLLLFGNTNEPLLFQWTGPAGFASDLQNPVILASMQGNEGDYSLVVTNSFGCQDSTVTHVIIHLEPYGIATSNSPVCSGNPLMLNCTSENSTDYQWSGPNGFTAIGQNIEIQQTSSTFSGIYNCTLKNSFGCYNVVPIFIEVIIHPLPDVNAGIQDSSLCKGDNLYLQGIASGGGNAGYIYHWSGPGGYSSSEQNPVISNVQDIHSGIYSLIVTDTNSCSQSDDSPYLIINPLPMAYATIVDLPPYCSGETLIIQGSASGGSNSDFTYNWTGPLSFNSTLQDITLLNVDILNSGVYSLVVTDSNHCSSENISEVNLIVLPSPVAEAGTQDSTPCQNGMVSLQGNASGGSNNYNYFWTGPLNYTSGFQNPVITNLQPYHSGYYHLSVFDLNTCTASDSVKIDVKTLPYIVADAVDLSICLNDTLFLISIPGGGSGPPYHYLWSGPSFSDTTQNPVISNIQFNQAGQYSVIVKDNNDCYSTSPGIVSIQVNSLPSALGQTPDTSLCAGDTLQLFGSGSGGSGTFYTYSWFGPSGFYSSIEDPKIYNIQPSGSGVYLLIITDGNDCKSDTSYTPSITVNSNPVVSIGPNLPVCENDPPVIINSGTPTGGSYFGPGVIDTIFDPSVTGAGTFTINYSFTDSLGCASQDSAIILVNPLPDVNLIIGPYSAVCIYYPPYQLTGGTPLMGYYTGSGVDSLSGIFTPSSVPPGYNSITYSYSDINGCINSAFDSIYVDLCTFNDPDLLNGKNIEIFPNPSTGKFELKTTLDVSPLSINVFNLMGDVLYDATWERPQKNSTYKLDLSSLNQGSYFIRIAGRNITHQEIIVITY
ncbi:MAG: T9SS type A sorting domain-containing protein [Bacteroidales bacterium]